LFDNPFWAVSFSKYSEGTCAESGSRRVMKITREKIFLFTGDDNSSGYLNWHADSNTLSPL
jgi:hypothetical protein